MFLTDDGSPFHLQDDRVEAGCLSSMRFDNRRRACAFTALIRRDVAYALPEADDDADRVSAGAELLQPARLVAHPSTMSDFLTPEYYQRIARTLEDGKIQMAFFDDRLALPDIYTGRRSCCGSGRRGAGGQDGSHHHHDGDGNGDNAAGARSDLLDDLL
jgi:hypothetical protein